MKPRLLAVVGTLAGNPYAGMAWMTMQITVGLRRLGHDVYYFEVTSDWPYDPVRKEKVQDSSYAVQYLERVARSFGLAERWAYRRSYLDNQWFGLTRSRAEAILRDADAVFNIAGATFLSEDGLEVRRPVYFGTDPVPHEIRYAAGDPVIRRLVDEHTDSVTYGENIGTPACPVPPLPHLRARTRQPVLLDLWAGEDPTRTSYTTVSNWKQVGLDVEFAGETYLWSKHHEFLKVIDLPHRAGMRLELAMNLEERPVYRESGNEAVPAFGLGDDGVALLEHHGWCLVNAQEFTRDPWPYRRYIRESRAEFTVARDLNVRLRSGWFSERSACYLAAGRPVITQNTGFGSVLPTGEGLFAFSTIEDVLAAHAAIEADYDRHSRAAHDIAQEYFRAETVMTHLLEALGT